jgi:hypothetical protein
MTLGHWEAGVGGSENGWLAVLLEVGLIAVLGRRAENCAHILNLDSGAVSAVSSGVG